MKKLVVFLMVLGLLMSVGGVARAAQFMNITFDGDTIGSAPITGGCGITDYKDWSPWRLHRDCTHQPSYGR